MPTAKGTIPRICETCGASFGAWPFRIREGMARFCSITCRTVYRRRTDRQAAVEHFWSRIVKTDDCWLWSGPCNRNGYGVVTRRNTAHRFSLELTLGRELNSTEWVLHRCDIPNCVRPSHLYVGTGLDNVRDRVVRNRSATGLRQGMHTHPEGRQLGEENAQARLTEDMVRSIRLLAGAWLCPRSADFLGRRGTFSADWRWTADQL